MDDREQFLAKADAVLAQAPLDYLAALDSVVRLAVPTLADYCSVDLEDPDGGVYRVVSAHRDPLKERLVRALWNRYPYGRREERGSPLVLRTGQPHHTRVITDEDLVEFAVNAEHLAMLRELSPRSYIAAPITAGSRTLGVLTFVMSESGRVVDDANAAMAIELGRRAGPALERAMLLREAQSARASAEASARRFAFLSAASQVLASSLDYEKTLTHVAQLTVPDLADWCTVELMDASGGHHRLTVAHADPGKVAWARELMERYPPSPTEATGALAVMRTGEPEFYPEVTEEMLQLGARDAEHLRLLHEAGISSAIIVPMTAREHVLGAITLISSTAERRYTADDLALAQELASRAGVAIDNAQLFRAAEEASRAKSEFLAVMSHELRTPINAILGYQQILELEIAGPLAPQQLQYVQRVTSSAKHLLGLINDVLDLSKIESGTFNLTLSTGHIADVVDGVLGLVGPQAEKAGVRLLTQDGIVEGKYIGDALRVRQILTNLLANGIKFTQRGGEVTVGWARSTPEQSGAVLLEPGREYLVVTVADTGIGIHARDLARIFEPFTQADSGYVRQRLGIGLGLAISRRLARDMGGDITVESTPDVGSRFRLWLPAAD